jgi:hypothetical protein
MRKRSRLKTRKAKSRTATRRKARKGFTFVPAYCQNCGRDTAPPDKRGRRFTWMVHDRLWKQVGMKSDEHLCWECFERRLGRKVGALDLKWVARG